MAGDWSSVCGFCQIVKDKVHALKSISFSEMLRECQRSTQEFMRSPLFAVDRDCQLLISGFDPNPRIVEASILQGKPKVELKASFGSIGWGANVASTLLSLREHHADMPLPYVAYLAYEAKRTAEKTGEVGEFTTLMIQSRGSEDYSDRAYLRIMNSLGKAHLEAIYSVLWKVPFAEVPELTPDFFHNLRAKQSLE
jgi:hypothetical protein